MALDVSGNSSLPGAAILTRPFDGTARQERNVLSESGFTPTSPETVIDSGRSGL